jgi:heterodisulfide reductase subunit A
MWDAMEKLGIRPERLQLEWISAAEAPRFAQIMRELEKMRQTVTSEEIEFTQRVLTGRDNAA